MSENCNSECYPGIALMSTLIMKQMAVLLSLWSCAVTLGRRSGGDGTLSQ